jgi:hypothetical protein
MAAAIASVHVGVIAWQQSRTTEQRTELHSGFIGLCQGAVAAFLITARAASRDSSVPLGQGEIIRLECGCFSDQKRAEEILERLGITPHKGVG